VSVEREMLKLTPTALQRGLLPLVELRTRIFQYTIDLAGIRYSEQSIFAVP
jgi:hypothetical protein